MNSDWLMAFIRSECEHARAEQDRVFRLTEEQLVQLERDAFLYELDCPATVH